MVSRAITTAEATLPKTLFKIPLENPSPFFSANPVPTFHCSNSTLAKAIRLGAAGARVICVDYYPHAQPIWRSPFLKPGESPKFTDPHHFPTHDVIMAAGGIAIFLKTDVNDGKELEEAVRETVRRTVLGGIEKLETVLNKTITEDGKSLEHIKEIVGGLGRIDM
jgi:NAD(P)-dependent dehydrogenase (short-subunit alcohol dehydrogenase family)